MKKSELRSIIKKTIREQRDGIMGGNILPKLDPNLSNHNIGDKITDLSNILKKGYWNNRKILR